MSDEGFHSTHFLTAPGLVSRRVRLAPRESRANCGFDQLPIRGFRRVSKSAFRVYSFRVSCVYLLRRADAALRDQRISETTVKRTLAVVPIHSEVNRRADPARGLQSVARILAAGYSHISERAHYRRTGCQAPGDWSSRRVRDAGTGHLGGHPPGPPVADYAARL